MEINDIMEKEEQLKLVNQVCFPMYSVSRLLTKAYKPYLDKLGITYPQYLVLLVLWETDEVSVNHISATLLLNTNTVSPLLKRMEKLDIIVRNRSKNDERSIIVCLTQNGVNLKEAAKDIPESLLNAICKENVKLEDVLHLKETLDALINVLSPKQE